MKQQSSASGPVARRAAPVLAGFVMLVAIVTACGSSGNGVAGVRPLDEILDVSIEITDLTPTSAVVRVETSIDVACSVVYGVDETYGSQSTDLDMGGQAHSSHSAPLRALQPDTEYHYRLQGTGSDGTFYVSDPMTLRTPPAAVSSDTPGTNLASLMEGARVVEAGSWFGNSATWQPENAIDGDPATEWSSNGDGDDAFLTIELAQPTELSAVGMWTRTMGTTGWCPSCRLAKSFLQQRGLRYREVDIEAVPEAADQVVAWTRGYKTVPTMKVGKTVVVDWNRRAYDKALTDAGY